MKDPSVEGASDQGQLGEGGAAVKRSEVPVDAEASSSKPNGSKESTSYKKRESGNYNTVLEATDAEGTTGNLQKRPKIDEKARLHFMYLR